MKVLITRIDKDLPLPQYQTSGAVAFDLISRQDIVVGSQQIGLIPANVIIKVPTGYALILASRSSTPLKKGLSTPHGVGIIDLDYHGPEDELKVQVFNFTNQEVIVSRGDRVAQGLFVKIDRFEFEEVPQISSQTRGGFGSTGK